METKKHTLTTEEYQKCTLHCLELIKNNLEGVSAPHIVSLYRGGLPFSVKISNILGAPLSIVDYQSYDGNSKTPNLLKDAGIHRGDLIVILDDICDSGNSLKLTEEYLRELFPFNKFLIYTLVGSKKHPKHFNYTIEHDDRWVTFEWEII